MLGTYYRLTKPGIVYGNVMSAAAGFLLAAHRHINVVLLIATLLGIGLVIASACVVNNYTDRHIDEKMERTRKRALVSGKVSVKGSAIYLAILAIFGFGVLALTTNALTVTLGAMGYLFYTVAYGVAKRRTVYGTLIGSVSGSMPLVAGYTAVANKFDGGALLLFLIMTAWQMPHFYAISIYRFNDYKAAGLPVWPIRKGKQSTKLQILLYTVLFTAATACLGLLGYAGKTYLLITVLLGLVWLWKGIRGLKVKDDILWARGMFGLSLIVLAGFSAALATNAWLP